MAKTARQLIIDSLRTSGAISAIEVPTNEEINHGLNELNGLLEQLDLDSLFPFTSTRTTFTSSSGDGEYTIGTGGDVSAERPNRITSVAILKGDTYEPIKELTIDEFYSKCRSSSYTGGTGYFAYESTYPLGTLHLYPAPEGETIELRYQYKNAEYDLDTEVSLPAGYYGTLQYQLAEILCMHYGLNPAIVSREASKRLARIKRLNSSNVKKSRNDYHTGRGKYNALTDTWGY